MRVIALLGALVMAFAALPGAAFAADPAPAGGQPAPSLTDKFSAADQYVESIPTSRGPKVPGIGSRRKHEQRSDKQPKAKLPVSVVTQLRSQPKDTAATLERIATEPDLGAPVEKLHSSRDKSAPRVPAAAVRAVGEGEEDSLLWLLIALIAITALVSGKAAHRQYERRNASRRG
jgi:hypothetical protein